MGGCIFGSPLMGVGRNGISISSLFGVCIEKVKKREGVGGIWVEKGFYLRA